MTDLAVRRALKDRLPRTWPAFFERHGNFTAAQLAAIPPLLDGENVVVCTPTASGKTAAAIAPLIERHLPPVTRRHHRPHKLAIIYLVPTRALVNDLAARLALPLASLGVSLAVKTGDLSTFRAARPPDVLLTTPESLDSLLAAHPKLLANVRAVVVDEMHLFDATPRGDHVRMLLSRIKRIRGYAAGAGDAPDSRVQYVALSATLPGSETVSARAFGDVQTIRVPSQRVLDAELLSIAHQDCQPLLDYLATFRARGWRKALVFCNSRSEVEAYAASVRGASPFGGMVYVHYSNIEARRRRDIESEFASSDAAICFTSSTLELGIDIGSIDVVILLGPPGSFGSFLQRIGRGNRRGDVVRVACFYRSTFERLIFEALAGYSGELVAGPAAFRPGVAIQQLFSLIKQSPTAALRLAELEQVFSGMLLPEDIQAIIGELVDQDYLQPGRPGEWRAGDRLNELFDEQSRPDCKQSIYSNVEGSAGRTIDIRDRYTQQVVARVDRQWLDRPALTLQGRTVNIEWSDGEALWISASSEQERGDLLLYRSERQLLSYDVARLLPERLHLQAGQAPFIPAPDGWWWFHCLGDLYGRALVDLLRYRVRATESSMKCVCTFLPDEPRALPSWTEAQVVDYLEDSYWRLEPMLALGPFHDLLPVALRRRTVVEQFDVPRFLAAVDALRPVRAPDTLAEDLETLLRER